MGIKRSFGLLVIVGSAALSIAACSVGPDDDGAPPTHSNKKGDAYVWRTGADSLYVRSVPGRSGEILASLSNGKWFTIGCQTTGETIMGTSIWDYLPQYGGYVSDYFVYTGYDDFIPGMARCDVDAKPAEPDDEPQSSAPDPSTSSGKAGAAIAEARKYLGYIEGAGDCNQFSTWMGRGCQQWCSDFVNYVWKAAGFDVSGITGYSGTIADYGRRHGTYKAGAYADDVQPGDAVLWGDASFSDHVGMVTAVKGDTIRVIHGNYHACNGGQGCVYEVDMSRSSTNAARGMPIYAYVSPVP